MIMTVPQDQGYDIGRMCNDMIYIQALMAISAVNAKKYKKYKKFKSGARFLHFK